MVTKVNDFITPFNEWIGGIVSYYTLENGKYQLITECFSDKEKAWDRLAELKKMEIK